MGEKNGMPNREINSFRDDEMVTLVYVPKVLETTHDDYTNFRYIYFNYFYIYIYLYNV